MSLEAKAPARCEATSSFPSDKTLEIKPVYLDMLVCEILFVSWMSTKDSVLLINIFESKLQMILQNIFTL